MTKDVAPERTGWRDEKISLRHRMWGFDCPAVDVDFVMVEFDRARVVAIVEYKNPKLAQAKEEQHKKEVGELWEARSAGKCVFVWVVDRDWPTLEAKLAAAQEG